MYYQQFLLLQTIILDLNSSKIIKMFKTLSLIEEIEEEEVNEILFTTFLVI